MKTGNTVTTSTQVGKIMEASMEPGHEDREYRLLGRVRRGGRRASMEPGHEDREYGRPAGGAGEGQGASMEPGHEDREYMRAETILAAATAGPQWSPVMKTGNTGSRQTENTEKDQPQWSPVMKTGNTSVGPVGCVRHGRASMEPGHEDREYLSAGEAGRFRGAGLNGARS